jgi:hypothetical protein
MLNRFCTDSVLFSDIRAIHISDLISHQNVFLLLMYLRLSIVVTIFNIILILEDLRFPHGVYCDMTDESRNSLRRRGCHY